MTNYVRARATWLDYPNVTTLVRAADLNTIEAGIASHTHVPAELGSGSASGSTFLRGDGTWAAPGGGLVLPVMGGGFSMPGNLLTGGSAEAYSNPVGPAGHFRGNLFRLLTTQTLTGIGCYISVASATVGATGRLGVYKWNSASLWDLVVDAGTVVVGTTGSKVITASQALGPGLYSAGIAGAVNDFSTFDYKGSPTFMTQADGAFAASAPQNPRWWIANPGPGTGAFPASLTILPLYPFDATTFNPVLVRFAQ